MDETTIDAPAFEWGASTLRYEKWINRARGEKHYKTLFFWLGDGRKMRYSRKNHKTATAAIAYASKFNQTVERLKRLGYL